MDAAAIPVRITLLFSEDDEVRQDASIALWGMEAAAKPVLLGLLSRRKEAAADEPQFLRQMPPTIDPEAVSKSDDK